jgi:hypothetical protein
LVAVATACSSGAGGGVAGTTTTTTTTAPSTTESPSTTLSQEEQVKQAYLAYWQTIDRVSATPNPNDPELAKQATDPLLSFLRDDFATRAAQGRTTRYPDDPDLNSHRIQRVLISGRSATIDDCFVDGRIAVQRDGTTNADVVTKATTATMILSGHMWLASDVRFLSQEPGVAKCTFGA